MRAVGYIFAETIIVLAIAGYAWAGSPNAGAHIAMMKCAGCHGDDGKGRGLALEDLNPRQRPISWTDKSAMAKFSDQQLAQIISKGGDPQDNPPAMPAFRDKLNPQDIDDVIAYIRSLAQ